MNSKVLFGLFILTLLTTGCVTEFRANLSADSTKILIISGNIIENTDVTFYINESFPLDLPKIPDESFIDDANLTIIGSNGYVSSTAINVGKGTYRIPVGNLEDDVEYGIEILYKGDTYRSSLSKPLYTPEIDSVSWVQPAKYGDVFFYVSASDNLTGSRFFAWSYTEDWEIMADFPTRIFLNPMSNTFFTSPTATLHHCWKTENSDGFISGSTESLKENRIINQPLYRYNSSDDRFSVLYSFTVNQRAISKGAYEYYQNIKKMNEEMGGLFTPQPMEITGNISCMTDPSKKVMGYVNINKNTTQKRVFIYSYQLTRDWGIPCGFVSHKDVLAFLKAREMTFGDYYRMGMRPAGDADPTYYPEIIPEMWASSYCTECTATGGTTVKPDFWPNDHK